MDAAEVLAQFDVHDLDGDGTVTLEEAYQVFTQDDEAEDEAEGQGN